MEFTNEQLQAIETRGRQLLVSAAAGSGKTAVLVERIIRRILDKDKPVDIDRMLVMTFTKAAASQMREKIIRAIEKRRAEDPSDPNLIRQSALVHNARITTIHGFCLDVIRDHFQEIGLDPDFRVADEGECRLLKKSVLEAVIEQAYEEGSDDFVNMTECLASGKSDASLEDILERMYDFSMSHPYPDKWLDKCVEVYEDVCEDTISGQPWMKAILDNAGLIVRDAADKAYAALSYVTEPDGPYMYLSAIEQDTEMLKELLAVKDPEGYADILNGISWAKLGRALKDGPYVDPGLQEKVKAIRNDYKNSVNKLTETYFALPLKEQVRRIKSCAPIAAEIVRLTGEVLTGYASVKRDKKVVDFNDLEHMCIRILSSDDGSTAKQYREFFEEIYVDEYQDSNLVQEELLKYIARDDNLFMVGDVKQSIYSFRLARPKLFTDKYESFISVDEDSTEGGVRVDLHNNFRSRIQVLDTVNELFSQIMSRELAGIEYDESARLNRGAEYPESENKGSELILIRSEDGINERELEARVTALRIKELMKEQTVFEPTEEEPMRVRPLKYSDIVILLRSARGWDEKYKKVLEEEGIPVHVMSRTGYFAAQEVSVLLDYLTVLDNPLQDIPMAAVLRSVFGSFNDEELALMRAAYPDKYLYGSVVRCAGSGSCEEQDKDNAACVIKAERFLKEFNRYRDKISYTPVYELLLEIIDTDYGICVCSQNNGRRALANLNMLLKKAEDYGRTSYKGLFHFVRYIEMLKKYEIDYGEANVLDENDDAVRIMTIHKSKGLEFPVCFVAGMHKDYNFMDANARVVTDVDVGLGISLVDPVKRIRQATPVKRALAGKKTLEILAEEERILYVAMTRAKEKLIMTGMVKDAEEALNRDKGVVKCTSYLDLVLHGLNNAGLPSLKVKITDASALVDAGIRNSIKNEAGREELKKILSSSGTSIFIDKDLTDILVKRLSFSYPYVNEGNKFEKISVTELKRRSMEESNIEDSELPERTTALIHEDESSYIPDFILKKNREVPAALHGTAVHRIFELWDYKRGTTDGEIREFLDHVRDKGLMEEELISCIGIDEVSGFLNGALAGRMKAAYLNGTLRREQPFIVELDGILVQGIIDAYFLEDDGIVIVDYKTDRVDDINELVTRYHVQLEYYARALSIMLDRPAKELIIYSTRYKNTVNIPVTVVY